MKSKTFTYRGLAKKKGVSKKKSRTLRGSGPVALSSMINRGKLVTFKSL